MMEEVVVDQVQEPVLIEIGLDLNVGNMIILQKTVQTQKQKENQEQIQQKYNLDKDKTALKVPVADSCDNLIWTNSDDAIDNLNL